MRDLGSINPIIVTVWKITLDVILIFVGNQKETVGFSAYSTMTRSYNSNEIVIFDELNSNFGQYFDVDSNTFVCPYDGIYWFSVSCYNDVGHACTPSLMVENQLLVQTIAPEDSESRNSASIATVAECKAGQRALVKNLGNNRTYNDSWDRTNTFSGYLLHVGLNTTNSVA